MTKNKNKKKDISVIYFSKIFPKALNLLVISLRFLDINFEGWLLLTLETKGHSSLRTKTGSHDGDTFHISAFQIAEAAETGSPRDTEVTHQGCLPGPRQTCAAGTPLPAASLRDTFANGLFEMNMSIVRGL